MKRTTMGSVTILNVVNGAPVALSRNETHSSSSAPEFGMSTRFAAQILGQISEPKQQTPHYGRRAYSENARQPARLRFVRYL